MPQKDSKAEFVRENFNLIAGKYDLFNDLNTFGMHRLWKNKVAGLISEFANGRQISCMDLCCGTGDISLRISNLREVQELRAVDFSENMLDIARSRLLKSSNSSVEQGDATNLHQFPDASIDALTIGFGLRNVYDINLALKEILRVLKPGGIFINLDVGKVKIPIINKIADFYFFKIVPLMGYIIWGGKNEMFDYLPVSSLHYPDQDNLKRIMEESGFQKVSYKNFVLGNVALHIGYKTTEL